MLSTLLVRINYDNDLGYRETRPAADFISRTIETAEAYSFSIDGNVRMFANVLDGSCTLYKGWG